MGWLAAMLGAAFACVGTAWSADTFTLRLGSDVETLDWTAAAYAVNTSVLKNIMEGLYELDADMKVQPRLAVGHTLSADGKVYTFHLRQGVRWTDGVELTAADFVESWSRLLAPASVSPYRDFLEPIVGVAEYRQGKLKSFGETGVRAVDKYTLEVRLKAPCAYFLQLLGMWVTYPRRADLFAKYGPSWHVPENLVTLGPFRLASHERGKRIVLKRNPTYYGTPPKLDEIRLEVIGDDETAARLYREGKVDQLWLTSSVDATAARGRVADVHSDVYPRVVYLVFDQLDYPLTFPKVRQAIAAAIDRTKLEAALHEPLPLAPSLVPREMLPETPDHRADVPPFNPTRARALWTESGTAQPGPSLNLELVLLATDQNALLGDALKEQLARNLGLSVVVQLAGQADFAQRLGTRAGSIFLREWGVDYMDVSSFMDVFRSDSGNNPLKWKNERYDALVKKAAELPLGKERLDLYRDALKILLSEEAAVVPLFFRTTRYALNPRIGGFRVTPIGDVFLRDVYVRK